MTRFIFTAKVSPFRRVTGSVDAETELDAINKLSRDGMFPLSVRREGAEEHHAAFSSKIKRSEIVAFTRQMANLTGAGINVVSGLSLVLKETSNRKLRSVVRDIIEDIKSGKSFSDGLARHPRLFDEIYRGMVKTGEESGNLKDVLRNLADFMEKEDEFRENIISALIYPLFVTGVGVITVIVLLIFVVPGLVSIFSDMGQALPLPTAILIASSSFIVRYGLAAAVFAAVLAFMARAALNRPRPRLFWDKSWLRMGIVGEISFKTETARLMKGVALLLSGGTLLTSALEKAKGITANLYLRKQLESAGEKIREGERFSRAMRSLAVFPESMLNVIAVGEETGSLADSLAHIALEYEQEVSRKLKLFTRILEPVIILLVGSVVAFIIVSMLLPIFELNFLVR